MNTSAHAPLIDALRALDAPAGKDAATLIEWLMEERGDLIEALEQERSIAANCEAKQQACVDTLRATHRMLWGMARLIVGPASAETDDGVTEWAGG